METFSEGNFEYKIISPQTQEEAVRVISKTFYLYEPIVTYLRCPCEVYEELVRKYLELPECLNLTVVCVHIPSRTVCGSLLSVPITSQANIAFSENSLNYLNIVFSILDALDEPFMQQNKLKLNKGLHQFLIAVDQNWSGNNIGYNLVLASIQAAKQAGLEFAISEATGPISHHILVDKHGYSPLNSIKYKDFLYNDTPVFENLEGSCKLVYKDI
jgi:hypothetical protein